MKKITLIIVLMIGSFGYSQTLPFNFSNPNQLMIGAEGCVGSLTTDAGNDVLQVVGGGTAWDHVKVDLVQNINLASDANNTITFRIKPSIATLRNHLLKFELGVNGPATAELPFTTTGTEWQNISLNFGAGLGNYGRIVIFTDAASTTLTGTYLIDDIAGATNVAPPVVVAPLTAAPTPPVRNAVDVMNFYSSAYTEITGTNWNPGWGQTTAATEVQIVGNATRKMVNLNYQGAEFSAAKNVSTMTNLHLDVWTPDCTSFKVFLISAGVENAATLSPTLSGWNSFDIPLTTYTVNLSAIIQFKFESVTPGTTVYMDNIYFWKPAAPSGTPVITGFSIQDKILGDPAFTLTAPTSDSPGAFSYSSSNTSVATVSGNVVTIIGVGTSTITANQAASSPFLAGSTTALLTVSPPAAPVPTLLASEVISMYGETYPNTYQYSFGSVAGEPDLNPTADVNLALKYNFEVAGYGAGYTATDVSAMQFVHFDYFTTNSANFKFVLISSTGEKDYVLPTSQAIVLNSWKSVNIPMSYFTGLGFNPATWFQFKFDVSAVTPGTPNVVYIDNVYFTSNSLGVKDFTSSNIKMYPNPTSSVFTIEANEIVESVSLFNVLGQEVVTKNPNSNSVTIDIASLQTGVYIVKTMIGGVSATSRIVKK